MNSKRYVVMAVLVLVAAYWLSCTKADDYKKYLSGGTNEIVYTGRADSLQAFPGRNRAELRFLLLSDPTITGVKVYWNFRSDSVVRSISRGVGVDTVALIVDSLPEGVVNFEVLTFDAKGHTSVPGDVTINVYGSRYESTLLDIGLNFYTYIPPSDALLVWGPYDPTAGLIGSEVQYTDVNGNPRDMVVPIDSLHPTADFPDFQDGNTLQYRTLYLPDPTSIDTFYSPYSPLTIQ